MVPQPPKVYPVHHMAQLQVGNPQKHPLCSTSTHNTTIRVLFPWLHHEEDARSLNDSKIEDQGR